MTTPDNPEGTTGETDVQSRDDADFTVDVGGRPVLVRPDVEVPLEVAVRGVDVSMLVNGLLVDADELRPPDPIHRRIVDAVENDGYELVDYESVNFAIPTADGRRLTNVEFECTVTGRTDDVDLEDDGLDADCPKCGSSGYDRDDDVVRCPDCGFEYRNTTREDGGNDA
ncbi:MAG: hypothetical protein SV760_07710 [Halobacteria archaeon]|nr:hypothetical protein [Halobacteria archaeon]